MQPSAMPPFLFVHSTASDPIMLPAVSCISPPLSRRLFNKADRIEERHTRQRQKAVKHVVLGAPAPDVDQLDDSAASLTVSASDSSLGEILSASPAACRLFGHSSTS